MTDSTQSEEFLKWHKKNRYIFHWTINGGIISIISLYVRFDDQKTAQRLVRALKYRGANASISYCTVSIQTKYEFGKFQQALRAARIEWEDFKKLVSYLYFDGTKHICDRKA